MARLRISLLSVLLLAAVGAAAQTTAPGVPPEPADPVHKRKLQKALLYRMDLAYRFQEPLVAGRDVSAPLKLYLEGRKLMAADPDKQIKLYLDAMALLEKGGFKLLPQAEWPANPKNIKLVPKEKFTPTADIWQFAEIEEIKGINFQVYEFTVNQVKQYGVVVSPAKAGKYPLLLYVHGAAYGVPTYALPWLARLAAEGYVIAGPAFRGEPLFAAAVEGVPEYRSDGQIENFIGEVDDALAMVDGAMKLPQVKAGKFGIVGHSFGSGVGLLVAARSKQVACVVSYDAWLTNPFQFYWERLAAELEQDAKEYLWGSWGPYLDQPAKKQLHGLMARSIVHHADRIEAPVLLLLGGAYPGYVRSAYHSSHKQLAAALKQHKKTFKFKIIPGGGHNFVLYYQREPAKTAYKLQMQWLKKYHPPAAAR